MAPAQSNASAKQRKGNVKNTQTGNGTIVAPDSSATRSESHFRSGQDFVRERPDQPPPPPSKLSVFLLNMHIQFGWPLLNETEMVVVYFLVLLALALTAAGAYKQLGKLGISLFAPAQGASSM